jgi:hypothetical protein
MLLNANMDKDKIQLAEDDEDMAYCPQSRDVDDSLRTELAKFLKIDIS